MYIDVLRIYLQFKIHGPKTAFGKKKKKKKSVKNYISKLKKVKYSSFCISKGALVKNVY